MEKIISFFERPFFRRIGMLLLLSLVLFLLKDMINIILLTFILAFLMHKIQAFVQRNLPPRLIIHSNVIYTILYLLLTLTIILSLYFTIPKLVHETNMIISRFLNLLGINISDVLNGTANTTSWTLSDFMRRFNISEDITNTLSSFNLSNLNIGSHLTNFATIILHSVKTIYSSAIQFFLAFILSLFLLIQKKRVVAFGALFEKSKISHFYLECKVFFNKFTNTFGVILQNQVIVSTINTVLSVIGLYILGYQNLVALGAMIFVLGLIPIAGVIISFIPLSLITFTMLPNEGVLNSLFGVQLDSVSRLLLLLLLVIIIHTIEAYIISPKLLSDKMKLPIFIVICVLLISDHYFGIWGLIVGIPIFIFVIDLLGIDPKDTLKIDSK